jgi:hypothetical protein
VFDWKVRRLYLAGDMSVSSGINRDPVNLVSARVAQIKRVLERAANRAAAARKKRLQFLRSSLPLPENRQNALNPGSSLR